jgi:hypothetical protein
MVGYPEQVKRVPLTFRTVASCQVVCACLLLAAHWGEGLGETEVPEPGSLALLAGIAVMGVVYLRRRKA